MQYEELVTFVTLAEVRSFTKTAEKLLMSQPSVSLHIKNLEEEFQTKLFHRSPRFLKITQSGELLLERAKQITKIYEKAKEDILELQDSIKGKIKIGASFTIGEYILPSLLSELQRKYQDLEFEVMIGNTEEIIQLVRLLEVDIGLIEGQNNDKELHVVPFMQDELLIVASKGQPLVKKKTVRIEDLQNQAWVTREKGSGTRDYLHHVISSNGLRVKSMMTISSNQGIKEAVINGMGLSLLSRNCVKRDLEHQYLSIIKLRGQTFQRTFSYIYSPLREKQKNVKAFIQALMEHGDVSL